MSDKILPAAVLLLAACTAPAPPTAQSLPPPSAWSAVCGEFDEWNKPGPPFRIYGDTYYVGTCGISAILVVGQNGRVLIDSGTDEGSKIVLANVRKLGFDPRSITTLLMSHEHIDHVGGMARIQRATGAPLSTLPAAAEVMRTGQMTAADPQTGMHDPFPPVAKLKEIADGATVRISRQTELRMIASPGHTLGAQTWTWRSCEGVDCKSIVYVDSLNPISREGYRFTDQPALIAGFRAALDKIESLDCDIVLAPHPSAVNLGKRLTGAAPLIDRGGCSAYVAIARQRLADRLAKERSGQ